VGSWQKCAGSQEFLFGDSFLGGRKKIEPAEPPFKLDDDDTFGCDEEAPPEKIYI